MTLADYIAAQQKTVDAALERWVPIETENPATVHRAMRYSLFAGGKRIRPLLAIAAAHAVSDVPSGIESAACVLELIHTYSLIHDDLPALDGEPAPILPKNIVRRTSGSLSSIDLGRGCPYQCSFCTIINVQGRKSRYRSPDDLERCVRDNCARGIKRFPLTIEPQPV